VEGEAGAPVEETMEVSTEEALPAASLGIAQVVVGHRSRLEEFRGLLNRLHLPLTRLCCNEDSHSALLN
jgi:hypothetical protein